MSDTEDILKTAAQWHRAGARGCASHGREDMGLLAPPGWLEARYRRFRTDDRSVSGGCVEGAVVTIAREIIRTGNPRLLDFGVSDEQAWR